MLTPDSTDDEVENFDQIANQFWSPSGPFAMLHTMNPVRMQFLAAQLSLSEKNVLDIGCGGGILAEALARSGATVTGIDPSPQAIQLAREHAHQNHLKISYHALYLEAFAADAPHSYDLITCMELIEHVPDPRLLIQTATSLLAPGGLLVISTINRTLLARLKLIFMAEQILRWIPKGTHRYEKFVRPSELDHICRDAGLRLSHRSGIGYHPFRNRFYLNDDFQSNYIAAYRLGHTPYVSTLPHPSSHSSGA
jgi:2-polyprenyl-6-hydroxyphenyl methylase/3-demethylubiquinone-9 3-methyltransferase